MPLSPVWRCYARYAVGGLVQIGPNVSSASGLPAGVVFPAAAPFATYVRGNPTTPGQPTGLIDGVPFRWWVVPAAVNLITIGPTSYAPPLLVLGRAAEHRYYGSGGTGPYTWEYLPPSWDDMDPEQHGPETTNYGVAWGLPPGVSFNSDGTITGVPQGEGTWQFNMALYDSAGNMNLLLFTWEVIHSTPYLDCNAPPDGNVGDEYDHQMLVDAEYRPTSVAMIGGELPPGLSLSAAGRITGIPTTPGDYSFTARVTDSFTAYPALPAGAVNVMDHGAAGDGETDDTAAVEAAIAAVSEGSVVYFPKGTYKLSSEVEMKKGVAYMGAQSNSILTQSTAGLYCFVKTASDPTDITIRNLTFDKGGVKIDWQAFGLVCQFNLFQNLVSEHGLYIPGGIGQSTRRAMVDHNIFRNSPAASCLTSYNDFSHVDIAYNRFDTFIQGLQTANVEEGVVSTDVFVDHNVFTGASRMAMELMQKINHLYISGNYFTAWRNLGATPGPPGDGRNGFDINSFAMSIANGQPHVRLGWNKAYGTPGTSWGLELTVDMPGSLCIRNVFSNWDRDMVDEYSDTAVRPYIQNNQSCGGGDEFEAANLAAHANWNANNTFTKAWDAITVDPIPSQPFDPSRANQTDTVTCSIYIDGVAPLSIACNNPPAGEVGVAYTHSLSVSGGTPPYTVDITAGGLPTGLDMDTDGQITGTPTEAGTFGFTATVTDSLGATASVTCSITIAANSPTVECNNPPSGTVNQPYEHQVLISGGIPPYTVTAA